jgi:tripartite-type tricarboxylate transporter receptor subunit TctC
MGRQLSTRSVLFFVAAFLLNLASVFDGWAATDDYPNRPVEIIVAFAPGQSNDLSSRLMAPYLQKYFNQPFLVVNKPGAGGKIGYLYVANSKPDGYTIGSVGSSWPVAMIMTPDLKYNMDSFIPIGLYAKSSVFFTVRGDSPWKTLGDFIADAKKNPGKLSWSTVGYGTSGHFVGLGLIKKAGIDVTFISYEGGGDTLNALLGKHIDMAVIGVTAGLLSSGKIRALASADKARLKDFPNIPTATELGYPVLFDNVTGLHVPKGTPKSIVDKLAKAYRDIIETNKTAITDSLKKMDLYLEYYGAEESAKKIREAYDDFSKLAPDVLKK